ncbi:MAG: conserved hypothetical protein, membrane [Candidatus Syntrophoarchaeum caldarius]|uniref:Uncharacterized protein n=1 Tax=Candidatus Syntropharchaeum caldarium TaxID=1838285 RepID=A0A1F2P7R9_9EURY|nr:MAG: conserved hypothetical protein, membrane [Candidatus Syntrophoarchaeum caldarius]
MWNSIEDKLKRYGWFLPIIASIVVFCILSRLSSIDHENARYILSAISQGLAAILALVFTITLVVAQMTRKYTAMDKIIFRPRTIILMLVFGIGIIVPLLALTFDWFFIGVIASIIIAVFCVFSLLPFLTDVNRLLKYEIGVGNLFEEIMEVIAVKDKARALNRADELSEIGKSAVKEFHEGVVESVIMILTDAGENSLKERSLYHVTYRIVWRGLKEIGVESVDKGFKDASLSAARGLRDIGYKASKIEVKNGLLAGICFESIEGLRDIGYKALRDGAMENVVGVAQEGLVMIATASDKSRKWPVLQRAVKGLWCIAAATAEYMPERVNVVIRDLKEIEKEIGEIRSGSMRKIV